MKKIILTISTFGMLVACSTSKNIESSSTEKVILSDLEVGQKLYPGLTQTELNDGKNLYESKCSACHAAKAAKSKSPNEWKEIVPKMSAFSNKKGKTITAEEENLILKYVVTLSSK